jgi:hypothetical protein
VANIGVNPTSGSAQIEQSTQFIDNLTWTVGHHTIKTGIDFQHTAFNLVNSLDRRFLFQGLSASNGRAAVTPLNQYLNTVAKLTDPATGRPFTYSQFVIQGGTPALDTSFDFVNLFVQDEYRVSPRLTLNFGLRYELLLFPTLDKDAPFEASRTIRNDGNNFAPRVGFSWSPFADQKTVVRGSYGVFYDTPGLNIFTNAALINGDRLLSYQIAGGDAAAPAFPNVVEINDPKFVTRPNITAFTRDFQIMYQQQANFVIQRQLTDTLGLSLQYSWAGTRQGPYQRDINLGTPTRFLADGRPVFGGNAARPDTRFNQINLVESGSNSNYNAFDLTLRRRFARGVSLGFTWGWGHALSDNLQEGTSLQDPTNRRRDYGNRESDTRHTIVLQGLYSPRFSSSAVKWLNGFEISTMTYYNSGYPINVNSGVDLNNDGQANDRPLYRGRNDVYGPELFQMDLRLTRSFKFRERYEAAAILETENSFNSTNPNCGISSGCTGAVVNNVNNADFGRITSARSARNVQFGFRFRF